MSLYIYEVQFIASPSTLKEVFLGELWYYKSLCEMASSLLSSAAVATAKSATPAQASLVAPFNGLKSVAAFPGTRKTTNITSLASNGGKVQCFNVSYRNPIEEICFPSLNVHSQYYLLWFVPCRYGHQRD